MSNSPLRVPIYQVDAFSPRRFGGNPAAVMVLPEYFPDRLLQAIAQENNLSETAFLVNRDGSWHLRWFTPTVEVPLCGHATLASAWVITEQLQPGCERVAFQTASGTLTVQRRSNRFIMDFPVRRAMPVKPPADLEAALGVDAEIVLRDPVNYVAVLPSADSVRRLKPDLSAIARLDASGVVVTAPGDGGYDCVSRYFAPAKGIEEDPVTGGAHCALAPYWAARLGKAEVHAFQASPRGGELVCRVAGDRVELEGACAFYLEGIVEL